MRIPNDELNKEIVLKHKRNPAKWSFQKLANHYKFKAKSTVFDIWRRNKNKYLLPSEKKAVRV